MPARRTEIAWNDVPPIRSELAEIAEDQIAFRISRVFIVWLFNESCTIHFDGVILRLRKKDILILAILARLDSFEVFANCLRERVGLGIDVINALDETPENSNGLSRTSDATRDASGTIPLAIRRVLRIDGRIQARKVE